MSAVPVLRGEGQLTDVRCLSEIKTPARSSEISSSGAMSVGTPRSLASSGQKNIQDIRHPLCAAEESASSRGGDALIHSGSGAAPAGGEKVRPVANTHRCLRDTLPCLRDSDERQSCLRRRHYVSGNVHPASNCKQWNSINFHQPRVLVNAAMVISNRRNVIACKN